MIRRILQFALTVAGCAAFLYLLFYAVSVLEDAIAKLPSRAFSTLPVAAEHKVFCPQAGQVFVHIEAKSYATTLDLRLLDSAGQAVPRRKLWWLRGPEASEGVKFADGPGALDKWGLLPPAYVFAIPRAGNYRLVTDGLDRRRHYALSWKKDSLQAVVSSTGWEWPEMLQRLRSDDWSVHLSRWHYRLYQWKIDGHEAFIRIRSPNAGEVATRLLAKNPSPPDEFREVPMAEVFAPVKLYLVSDYRLGLANRLQEVRHQRALVAMLLMLGCGILIRIRP